MTTSPSNGRPASDGPDAAVAGAGVLEAEALSPVDRISEMLFGLLMVTTLLPRISNQPRTDVVLFNTVRLRFTLGGTDASRAAALVEAFKRR